MQQVRSWWRSEREELELQLCRSSSSSSSPRPRPTPTAASARKQRPNNRGRGFFSYCSTTPLPRHSQQRNDLGLPSTYPPTYLPTTQTTYLNVDITGGQKSQPGIFQKIHSCWDFLLRGKEYQLIACHNIVRPGKAEALLWKSLHLLTTIKSYSLNRNDFTYMKLFSRHDFCQVSAFQTCST